MKYQAYASYKDSGVEWLGEVPEHWEVLAIKRLTNISRGASPRPIDDPKYFDDDGEYLWTRIADVSASNVYLYDSPQKLSKLGASLSVKLKPESLFLSIAGTVGKVCITARKACIHDGFVYFPNLKQNSKYFFYIFDCGELYKGLGKMNTQLNLNTETVGSIKISLPPIQEQTAIADFLDRETRHIDELSKEKQGFIELLKEKRQALISHAVTKGLNPTVKMKKSGVDWLGEVPEHWKLKKIKRIASLRSGDFITSESINESGLYPVFGGNGLRGYTDLFTHDGQYVLIGRQGALCGNINYAKGRFWASEHAVVVIPYKLVSTTWLAELFRTMNLNQYSISSAQPGLSVERIINLQIPVPAIEEQTQIASYLDQQTRKIDALITETQHSINLLKEHRAALISAAVTGKIDVRMAAA